MTVFQSQLFSLLPFRHNCKLIHCCRTIRHKLIRSAPNIGIYLSRAACALTSPSTGIKCWNRGLYMIVKLPQNLIMEWQETFWNSNTCILKFKNLYFEIQKALFWKMDISRYLYFSSKSIILNFKKQFF